MWGGRVRGRNRRKVKEEGGGGEREREKLREKFANRLHEQISVDLL